MQDSPNDQPPYPPYNGFDSESAQAPQAHMTGASFTNQVFHPAASKEGTPNTPAFPAQYAKFAASQPPPNPQIPFAPAQPQPPSGGSGKIPFLKRPVLKIGAAGAFSILVTAGAVFGWYLPNKPENVWKAGLERSGQAFEQLAVSALSKENIKKIERSEFSGSIEATTSDFRYWGTIDSKYGPGASDSNLDLSYTGTDKVKKQLGLKFLSETKDGSDYPDIYFRLTGLKSLGTDLFMPGLSEYDGRWISVSSDYIKSLVPAGADAAEKEQDFTYADASELTNAIADVTREYVFTSRADKAVIVRKQFVATETVEGGQKANRYKAGINKNNAKKYCKALIEKVVGTKAYAKLPFTSAEDAKDLIKQCDSDIDTGIKESDSFEMWIDKKYKLIYKIRVTKPGGMYWEIGQRYGGGDNLPMFINSISGKQKSSAKFSMDINRKSGSSRGSFVYEKRDEDPQTVKLTFQFKPYTGEIKIQKPASTVPIQEVLNKMGIDPAALGGLAALSADSNATPDDLNDVERKTDVNTLQSFLEVYYAENGYYPGIKDLNNPAWRAQNMDSFNDEILKDPGGASAALVASPEAARYVYAPSGCNPKGSNCSGYLLIATLSGGAQYKKASLQQI